MAAQSEIKNMAVFCDFENVALGVRDARYDKFAIKRVLERLLLKGSIVVKKAYCDWERYKEFKGAMHEAAFELIEIPHVRMSGKNSADIRMVVDALDLCYTKAHVDTFVIISGDSDFSPLVSKLRENNKTVIGVGVKQSTSDLLMSNCDEFIYYDDLVREDSAKQKQRTRRRAPAKAVDAATRTVDVATRTVEAVPRTLEAVPRTVDTTSRSLEAVEEPPRDAEPALRTDDVGAPLQAEPTTGEPVAKTAGTGARRSRAGAKTDAKSDAKSGAKTGAGNGRGRGGRKAAKPEDGAAELAVEPAEARGDEQPGDTGDVNREVVREVAREAAREPVREERTDEDRRQDALDLLMETVEALIAERGEEEKIWGSMVKQTLKRRKPGFNESYYGYRAFADLLEDARDRSMLTLERDEKSGGYIIRIPAAE